MVPGRSRRDAERMIEIAGSDDPEAAYQKKLEKHKEYNDRYQRKKLGAPFPETEEGAEDGAPSHETEAEPEPPPTPKRKPRYTSAEGDDDLIDQVEDLFRQLSWDGRDRALKRISKLYNDWQVGKP
jgi:hypothetical protein